VKKKGGKRKKRRGRKKKERDIPLHTFEFMYARPLATSERGEKGGGGEEGRTASTTSFSRETKEKGGGRGGKKTHVLIPLNGPAVSLAPQGGERKKRGEGRVAYALPREGK